MAFDIEGARRAGYSEAEIADYLAGQSRFDSAAARKAGYSDAEILSHLGSQGGNAAARQPERTVLEEVGQGLGNLAAGAVRGAGSIGATLLYPYDKARDLIDRANGVSDVGLSGLITGQKRLSRNEQRRADMDAALQSMGAETDSLLYKGGKIGTEIAGTLPVGGLLGRGAAALGATPRVVQALTTSGLQTGAVPAGLVQRAGDMALRTAAGAASGGASAALVNPDDVGTGALYGAAMPGAIKVLGMAGHAAGRGLNAVGSVVSDKAAQRQALGQVRRALGPDNVTQAVGDLQTYFPKLAEDIPLTSAAITRSPELAKLEQASRLRSAPAWLPVDQRRAAAVWGNVQKATGEADELGARIAQRQRNWADNWAKAEGGLKPRIWRQRMGQLGDDIETALRAPEASNPDVRRTLEALREEVVRIGPDFSPAHLQQIRANFNAKYLPGDPNAFKSVPRDLPAVKSLIAELDGILNAATGQRWDKVRQGYAADSAGVQASKAAGRVRDAFLDTSTGQVRGTAADALGDVPLITETGLGRAMNAARGADKRSALSADAVERLGATMEALRRQAMVQQMKRSASAGGGSDTVSNLASLAPSGGSGLLSELISLGRRAAMGRTDSQMAGLLSDPDLLARLLAAPPNRRVAGLLDQAGLLAARATPLLAVAP